MDVWTRNEVVEEKLNIQVAAFRAIADFVEKYELDYKEVVKLLRESAEECEAQIVVVRLRDTINDL